MNQVVVRDAPPSSWAQALLFGSIVFAVVSFLLLTSTL
jgi:hypothetical protein